MNIDSIDLTVNMVSHTKERIEGVEHPIHMVEIMVSIDDGANRHTFEVKEFEGVSIPLTITPRLDVNRIERLV